VMVVLVFFLLLAGRFDQTHSLSIVPPSTTTGAAQAAVPSLVLSVDKDGKLFLEGKEVARAALEQALAHDGPTVINVLIDREAGATLKTDPRVQMILFDDLASNLKTQHSFAG
jgi:biopolymer transport protein ExbD